MTKISVFIDTVLTAVALFFLGVLIAGYFTSNGVTTVLSSLVFALTVTFFTGRFAEKRRAPAKKKDKLLALMNKFVFSPPQYAYDFVLHALEKKGAVREENGFICTHDTAFFVRFTGDAIGRAELATCYAQAAQLPVKKLVIFTSYGALPEADETARVLTAPTTEIWDFAKAYDLFVYLGCPPTETLALKLAKKRFGAAFAGALRRANARKYLLSALVMLLFARFMPYAVFYAVLSAVSLTLAVLCRLRITERLRAKKT